MLASESPRRRELMALLGLPFRVRAAGIAETPHAGESPVDAVQRLAREKATTVARQIRGQDKLAVIGADTTVVLDGDTLGKPSDPAKAVSMLSQLRGREHEVYTALYLQAFPDGGSVDCLVRTVVPMRDYTDHEIREYVSSGDPFDKAGAYAIQHPGFRPVTALRGCYANVMGLPLCHLVVQLQRVGIEIQVDIASSCQRRLNVACQEYPNILVRSSQIHSSLNPAAVQDTRPS